MTIYLTHPVLDLEPDWSTDPAQAVRHPYELAQFLGAAEVRDLADESRIAFSRSWTGLTREAAATLLAFFDAIQGRLSPFWAPSWLADAKLSHAAGAGDTDIYVENIGFTDYWIGQPVTGRHLFIVWPDGTYVCRSVLAATDELFPGYTGEQLTLDSSLGRAAGIDEVMISFLHFCRFDQDELSLDYETAEIAGADLALVTVPAEAPGVPE